MIVQRIPCFSRSRPIRPPTHVCSSCRNRLINLGKAQKKGVSGVLGLLKGLKLKVRHVKSPRVQKGMRLLIAGSGLLGRRFGWKWSTLSTGRMHRESSDRLARGGRPWPKGVGNDEALPYHEHREDFDRYVAPPPIMYGNSYVFDSMGFFLFVLVRTCPGYCTGDPCDCKLHHGRGDGQQQR